MEVGQSFVQEKHKIHIVIKIWYEIEMQKLICNKIMMMHAYLNALSG